jgi:hypothetical protein
VQKPRVTLGITLDDAEGKRVFDSKVAVDGGDYLVVARSMRGGKGRNRDQLRPDRCRGG